ncbi:MAG: hypothetical protein D6689_08195 [Deltaproteobacteria bacterium]|nr:MAG: hypothetical protein D6689_08195 [Deltaproteobacteria bacterium]
MKTHETLTQKLVGAVLGLALVATSAPAAADPGHTVAELRRAIASGVPSAIVSQIEHGEFMFCASCIPDMMQLLDHPEYEVREAAAWWFAARPAQMEEIAERSLAYLQMNDSIKARNAADALGAFQLVRAIPALSAAIVRTDLDAEARVAIARALGRIGHPDANPALAAAMKDPDPAVRREAVTAWREIRGQTSAAPAVALLADRDATVRRAAASLVGRFRQADARAELERLVASDADAAVRRNAAWALGRIGDPASRGVLEAALTDPSGLVRGVARVALSQLR